MLTLITNVEVGGIEEKASTLRLNYPFNSFLELDGEYFGLSSAGIFSLGGDTDDDAPISWSFELPTTDLGTPKRKRLEYLLSQVRASGSVSVYVSVDDGQLYGPYEIPADVVVTGDKVLRTKLPKGLFGTNWRVRFVCEDGDDVVFRKAHIAFGEEKTTAFNY